MWTGERVKYIIVTGGVISGIGKGLTSASIGRILQSRGFKVTSIKIDPYLNCDAGTINPFEHGEIFVTDDGGEIDLDMGHYERFLDVNLTKKHNFTTGQIYGEVIRKERKGDYLGQTVQIIPHVTDLIKSRIRQVASESNAEVCMVEVGGTVGDIESMPYVEAVRQLALEEGMGKAVFVHLTLVPELGVVGEQKTKPTQHSVKQLLAAGIAPHFLICRAKDPLSANVKRKISLFCNVPEEAVISAPDVSNIYELPIMLDQEGLGDLLLDRLCLRSKKQDLSDWKKVVGRMEAATKAISVAMVGKYITIPDTYLSINEALKHAAGANNCRAKIDWIDSEKFEKKGSEIEALSSYDGILVPGGFGPRGSEGIIATASYAKDNSIPFLGLCFGFQLAVVAVARSMEMKKANSTELDAKTPYPVIDILPEQKKVSELGGTMRLGAHDIRVSRGTGAFQIYGREKIRERHRHRFEVNPKYIGKLTKGGLKFSGKSLDGRRMEILELTGHPFFMATQFHPEFKSRPEKPSPIFEAFVRAAVGKK